MEKMRLDFGHMRCDLNNERMTLATGIGSTNAQSKRNLLSKLNKAQKETNKRFKAMIKFVQSHRSKP